MDNILIVCLLLLIPVICFVFTYINISKIDEKVYELTKYKIWSVLSYPDKGYVDWIEEIWIEKINEKKKCQYILRIKTKKGDYYKFELKEKK